MGLKGLLGISVILEARWHDRILMFVFKEILYLKEGINYITLIPGYDLSYGDQQQKKKGVFLHNDVVSVSISVTETSVYSKMQKKMSRGK